MKPVSERVWPLCKRRRSNSSCPMWLDISAFGAISKTRKGKMEPHKNVSGKVWPMSRDKKVVTVIQHEFALFSLLWRLQYMSPFLFMKNSTVYVSFPFMTVSSFLIWRLSTKTHPLSCERPLRFLGHIIQSLGNDNISGMSDRTRSRTRTRTRTYTRTQIQTRT